jgi:predicted DNA-binding transcriptional regulator AlpA
MSRSKHHQAESPGVFGRADWAEFLGKSGPTVDRYIAAGKLPPPDIVMGDACAWLVDKHPLIRPWLAQRHQRRGFSDTQLNTGVIML